MKRNSFPGQQLLTAKDQRIGRIDRRQKPGSGKVVWISLQRPKTKKKIKARNSQKCTRVKSTSRKNTTGLGWLTKWCSLHLGFASLQLMVLHLQGEEKAELKRAQACRVLEQKTLSNALGRFRWSTVTPKKHRHLEIEYGDLRRSTMQRNPLVHIPVSSEMPAPRTAISSHEDNKLIWWTC